MPIHYAEWACDLCGSEETTGLMAFKQGGKIVCETCGKRDPDRVLMWIEISKIDPYEFEAEPEEEPEEAEP